MSAQREFERVAVLNRGEAAVRFLRTLRPYARARNLPLRGIALYTDPDADAPFVRLADEAVALGPALRETADGRHVAAYADLDFVMEQLRAARIDAVWPGWGFVSEDPAFVARLEAAGIVFIGPDAHTMRSLGDKIEAKRFAEQSDVPLAPWKTVPIDADEAAWRGAGDAVGYPLMVKAAAGGGGRGIRRVDSAEGLMPALASVRAEVAAHFGGGGVLLEACVDGARHVEVQLIGGVDRVHSLGVRDCTMQRRHQKVIEETPSPVLPPAVAAELEAASIRLAERVGYRGAGTAEYLYDPQSGQLSFLEINARLQVEHTVTEAITGADLVAAQLDIARGLPWEPPEGRRGHAIEVRLCAEDPADGFKPRPGKVRVFNPAQGPGIRVDTGVEAGQEIAPQFDSMIAKVIAWGADREQARVRLVAALAEMDVLVEEGSTNTAFLARLLEHPAYVENTAHTTWLDGAPESLTGGQHELEATVAAAILEGRRLRQQDVHAFFSAAQDGIPQQLPVPDGRPVDLRVGGRRASPRVCEEEAGHYTVHLDGRRHPVVFEQLDGHSARLKMDGVYRRVLFAYGGHGIAVAVDGATHTIERAAGGVVRAPAPGVVVAVSVSPGNVVEAGDTVCTLEAMKMEMAVGAPEGGVVRAVVCRTNEQVVSGQQLILIEPGGETEADGPAPGSSAERVGPPAGPEWVCATARAIFLGFDVTEDDADHAELLLSRAADESELQDPEAWSSCVELLSTFADAESVFDRNLLPLRDARTAISAEVLFYEWLRHQRRGDAPDEALTDPLNRALSLYGADAEHPGESLRAACFRLAVAHAHGDRRLRLASALLRLTMRLHSAGVNVIRPSVRRSIDRIVGLGGPLHRSVEDNARQARYVLFEQPRYEQRRRTVEEMLDAALASAAGGGVEDRRATVETLAASPYSLSTLLLRRAQPGPMASVFIEAVLRRLYAGRELEPFEHATAGALPMATTRALGDGKPTPLLVVLGECDDPKGALDAVCAIVANGGRGRPAELLLGGTVRAADFAERLEGLVAARWDDLAACERLTVSWSAGRTAPEHRTFAVQEMDAALRSMHPEDLRRVEISRLANFDLTRLEAADDLNAFLTRARSNPADERVFVFADLREGPSPRDRNRPWWALERAFYEAIGIIRTVQAQRGPRKRLHGNRIYITVRPTIDVDATGVAAIARQLEASTRNLGIEKVVFRARIADATVVGGARAAVFEVARRGRHRLEVREVEALDRPVRARTRYWMKAARARQLQTVYPYEVVRMLLGGGPSSDVPHETPHPDIGRGWWQEYDLDPADPDRLAPVERDAGGNVAGVVVGVITNNTAKHPDGMRRVWIASDATHAMGALAEPECRRILGAIDLAAREGLPIEWLTLSAGARIAMDSGTENLDWTARVLRRLVEHTQAGGEVNIIVNGVNVGAQSYWNAEAAILMHTRGCLIMTEDGSMVLTGKKALGYSGGVTADDERGIGGFERVMGPNGEAQMLARDLGHAYSLLFEHYRFTYAAVEGGRPAAQPTSDPADRSILETPYVAEHGETFATVGDVFSPTENPGRKKPFDIRQLMGAVVDADGGHLERWRAWRGAETAVVWDAHLGGEPVCLVGIESRPQPRRGWVPLDGPDSWSGSTLFPQSARKIARALNAASGRRPAVVLANLSGFDGSPESMRRLQLEHGGELGRAVVNFDGPLIFLVVGRYHGGAYVVFSKTLNPGLKALAVEGSFASVIGGAPAAAVVFTREVRRRVEADPRMAAARAELDAAPSIDQPRLREALDAVRADLHLEHQGDIAAEFDAIHTVERAVQVGSLDAVIPARAIRPALIEAVRGA